MFNILPINNFIVVESGEFDVNDYPSYPITRELDTILNNDNFYGIHFDPPAITNAASGGAIRFTFKEVVSLTSIIAMAPVTGFSLSVLDAGDNILANSLGGSTISPSPVIIDGNSYTEYTRVLAFPEADIASIEIGSGAFGASQYFVTVVTGLFASSPVAAVYSDFWTNHVGQYETE